MSVWTHIAGIIRIDQLPLGPQMTEKEVEKLVSTGSPEGSEGGLTIRAHRTQVLTRAGGPLCWGFVSAAGDLRDFGSSDLPKVTKWLEDVVGRLTARFGVLIRQAIFLVEPEDAQPVVYVLQENNTWRSLS